jgi:serine/threonine protein phosphatase PrpC
MNDILLYKDFGVHLDQNSEIKEQMEDFCKVHTDFLGDKNILLLTLFDGHTGSIVAKSSIDLYPEILKEEFKKIGDDKTKMTEAFQNSIKILDEKFTEYNEEGSTAVIVYLCIEESKKVLYSVNVGDSRAVVVRNSSAERLSYDHKCSDLNEKTRVKKEGGIIINGRLAGSLAITRSLGDYSLKNNVCKLISEPYIKRYEITEDDLWIVVASDGIWDVINEEKLVEFFADQKDENPNGSTQKITENLVNYAIEEGSRDNISSIIVRLK